VQPQFIVAALIVQEQRVLNGARGVNTEGLTLEFLSKIPIPDINSEDQKLFVRRVASIDTVEAEQSVATTKYESLFASLTAQAFSGELTAVWCEQRTDELLVAAARRDALLRERGAQLAAPNSEERVRIEIRGKAGKSIEELLQGLYDTVQVQWKETAVSLAQPLVEGMRGYMGQIAQQAAQRMQSTLAASAGAAMQTAVARMSEVLAAPISTFIEQAYAGKVAISFEQEIANHPREHILRRIPVSHVLVWLTINSESGYTTLESLHDRTGLSHKPLGRILDLLQASGLIAAVSLPANPSGVLVFVPAFRAFDAERDEVRAEDMKLLEAP